MTGWIWSTTMLLLASGLPHTAHLHQVLTRWRLGSLCATTAAISTLFLRSERANTRRRAPLRRPRSRGVILGFFIFRYGEEGAQKTFIFRDYCQERVIFHDKVTKIIRAVTHL